MKKIFVVLAFLLTLFSGCSTEDDTTYAEIREIVWNSLTTQEKSTVTIDWKQAPVEETTYQDMDVYSVQFNTSDEALLGPILVYVDRGSLKVLGQALRM